MNLVVHGSRAGDSLVMVDGMPIINGSGAGGLQYGNYLNNAMAQEITFQTDSQAAEFERASVYSNFIPKEGSNVFHGRSRAASPTRASKATTWPPTYIAQGLKSGSKVDKIWDVNPAAGGPIIKDKMWIYAGYRHWGTYNTVAGSFKDASFTEFPYYSCAPDASGACTTEQNLFPVWHWAADARLTTQLGAKNKVNLYYDPQYTYFGNCFVPTLATAISACPEYKNIPQYIVQGSWSSPVTNKLLLEAGATLTAQDFHGYPRVGLPLTQFAVSDTLAPAGSPTTWGSATLRRQSQRPVELPRVGLVRHRHARRQGRVHADAPVAAGHDRSRTTRSRCSCGTRPPARQPGSSAASRSRSRSLRRRSRPRRRSTTTWGSSRRISGRSSGSPPTTACGSTS